MSIDDVVQRAIERGDLACLPMLVPSDPRERVMLLGEEVSGLIMGPFTNVAHERRAFRLRADLESFVKGEEISICLTPRKAGDADFGLLDPPGQATWDVRSRDPKPGLRVIGRFAATDVFVALGWWPRSVQVSWSEKPPLVDDELLWRIAIHDCDEKWNRILPGLVPVSGGKAERYVSEHYTVV